MYGAERHRIAHQARVLSTQNMHSANIAITTKNTNDVINCLSSSLQPTATTVKHHRGGSSTRMLAKPKTNLPMCVSPYNLEPIFTPFDIIYLVLCFRLPARVAHEQGPHENSACYVPPSFFAAASQRRYLTPSFHVAVPDYRARVSRP